MTVEQATEVAVEKRCKKCGGPGPFWKNHLYKDGLQASCIECQKKYYRERRSTPRGVAKNVWNGIQERCLNRCGHLPTYQNVECRITRTEFIEWYAVEAAKWIKANPGKRPSVDRIDGKGHYEFSNMQILELGENCRKRSNNRNVSAPDGMAWCGKCERHISATEFHKSPSTWNGLQPFCKSCRSAIAAERYKKIRGTEKCPVRRKSERRDAARAAKALQQN